MHRIYKTERWKKISPENLPRKILHLISAAALLKLAVDSVPCPLPPTHLKHIHPSDLPILPPKPKWFISFAFFSIFFVL